MFINSLNKIYAISLSFLTRKAQYQTNILTLLKFCFGRAKMLKELIKSQLKMKLLQDKIFIISSGKIESYYVDYNLAALK